MKVRRDAHRYCAFYCEENIWHLAGEPRFRADAEAEVWLITNANKTVATWGQRASSTPDIPVVWDYHIVVASPAVGARGPAPWQVWDFDHRGPFVRPALEWLRASFPIEVVEDMAPRFRCIAAADYVRDFRSDRGHMRSPEDPEQWSVPPPDWPEIGLERGESSNLFTWLALEGEGPGRWQDLPALGQRLRK